MSKNLYDILGCHQSNSTEQIMQEYRKLAKKFHPDKCSSDEAEHFKNIQYAKDILTDVRKKEHYDLYLKLGNFMPLKDWMDNLEHFQQSLHWRTPKPQQSLAMKEDKGEIERGNEVSNLLTMSSGSSWRRHNNETINAFRNYEI
uniref:J domain-containing protein n=1 Tax=Strongyloides papillosus TaxID=174720 RepID=A0A0N5C9E8_STREA